MGELPLNILYIHGFGSQYDSGSKKAQTLESIGKVHGINVDYCRGFDNVYNTVKNAVLDQRINLIVGTSMGGYIAGCVGAKLDVPFVALNPAIAPRTTLQRWVGNFTDYAGNYRSLTESMVSTYPNIPTNGTGLILLQAADEVIHAHTTEEALSEHYKVIMYPGGTHRFENLEKCLPEIKAFINSPHSV